MEGDLGGTGVSPVFRRENWRNASGRRRGAHFDSVSTMSIRSGSCSFIRNRTRWIGSPAFTPIQQQAHLIEVAGADVVDAGQDVAGEGRFLQAVVRPPAAPR